jgi:Pyruvate/2-oxoacid:ferredoxin oxidoreductase gamma subunit
VSKEAMRHAVAESVPGKMVEMNLRVFEAGYEEGRRQLAAQQP